MLVTDGRSLAVNLLLKLLVMAMIGIHKIFKFTNLLLEMDSLDFCIVECGA